MRGSAHGLRGVSGCGAGVLPAKRRRSEPEHLPPLGLLQQTRANIWRYPPRSRGRRHIERAQEEVFVVLEGTATFYLGDPAEPFELPRGSVAVVEAGTAVQVANVGSEDVAVFIVGAPPEQAGADYLPDAG